MVLGWGREVSRQLIISYFRECDQGHDHVHHDDRDHVRGEVGQAHVGVNGIVKDKVRGENPLFLMIQA